MSAYHPRLMCRVTTTMLRVRAQRAGRTRRQTRSTAAQSQTIDAAHYLFRGEPSQDDSTRALARRLRRRMRQQLATDSLRWSLTIARQQLHEWRLNVTRALYPDMSDSDSDAGSVSDNLHGTRQAG